jgi:molybdopterin/thiamine biosynthesis adenylyltransferase
MEIWFLNNSERLSLERNAIQHLEETVEWLEGIAWSLDGKLNLEATIHVHGHQYKAKMSYPALFPAIPPTVQPLNQNEHWSDHQYASGTLCLEWGPDTWHPDVTGAQMLESLYKLLYIENPRGSNRHEVAPSRHHLTPGQTLRGQYGRFYAGNQMVACLTTLPGKTTGALEFSILRQSNSFLVLIQEIQPTEMPVWENTYIPQGVRGSSDKGTLKRGVFYKTELDPDTVASIKEMKDIETVLQQAGYGPVTFAHDDGNHPQKSDQSPFGILLLDCVNEPHFFLSFDLDENQVFRLAPVKSDETGPASRTPTNPVDLSGKSVGIVGLGSMGSKIVLSLARIGVSRFYLVDEDILLPENVCRHVLDWQNMGEHKVDAIAEILSRIVPNIEVDVSRLHLTGQEANSSLSSTLNKLGQCDLVIDATADPQVFNLMAAIATTHEKPLVWLEVFAGGIGGMIARSRPGKDPDPHTMRAALHQFTTGAPPPNFSVTVNYTTEDVKGNVLAASDADVGVLAYHVTRLVTDTLTGQELSMFPHSMYLIGLARSWVFEAPFYTIPIATDHLLKKSKPFSTSPELLSDNIAFLSELLQKKSDADSST